MPQLHLNGTGDCAQLCAEAIHAEKKTGRPLMILSDVPDIIRPIIAAHVAEQVAAAIPLRHTGTKKVREALFNAVCEGCGLPVDGMTKPMQKAVATSRALIVQVMPNVTADEIVLRAKQYRRKHPTWELTPFSLAKYWGSLATEQSMQGRLDEPKGWRQQIDRIFPDADCGATGMMLAKSPWPMIARAHQERICRLMAITNGA